MSNPIPVRHRAAFLEHMRAGTDQTNHWAMLDLAEEFMLERKYGRGDPATALRFYQLAEESAP